MALVHRPRHPVDRGALHEGLVRGRIACHDRVERGREFREIGPLAASECRPVDRRGGVDLGVFQVFRDPVEGSGDQLLGRRLVHVALDQDRIRGLGGLVLGLRRQQLVLQIRGQQAARGRDERHGKEQGKCARTHLFESMTAEVAEFQEFRRPRWS